MSKCHPTPVKWVLIKGKWDFYCMQITILLKDFAWKASLSLSHCCSHCFIYSSGGSSTCCSNKAGVSICEQPWLSFLVTLPFWKGVSLPKRGRLGWGKCSKVSRWETTGRQHKIVRIKRTVLSQTADVGLLPPLSGEGSYKWGSQMLLLRISGPCLQAVLLLTGEQSPRLLEGRTKYNGLYVPST